MRNTKDNHKTTEWAIAKVSGVSAVAVGMHFKLANRVTGRAHDLYFIGGGFTLGVQGKVPFTSGKLSYKSFRTRKPVNFEDFKHVGARISGVTATLGVGYSKSYITIWPGAAHSDKPLVKISMGGWSVGKLGISGQAATYGYMSIEYGDGEPHGLFPRVLEIEEKYEPIERLTRVKFAPNESPLMAIPGDVIFAFDSHTINPAAHRFLRDTADVIELRDRGRVEIAGHTDAVGRSAYNKQLSLKRAVAVKQWLVQHRVHNANQFQVVGYGEEKPSAPNKLPNGSDNPEGRRENRRVEIIFHY
jgi:outer membrane protein OmpA-like peptidoglycan-associated protein